MSTKWAACTAAKRGETNYSKWMWFGTGRPRSSGVGGGADATP